MSDTRRRLAAIMFTDIVGFTALGQKDESLSLLLLEKHRELIRPVLRRYYGKEIKTIGDAFLVEFDSALEAVKCAYDIQKAVREFNSSEPQKLQLRIGIHVGDVIESANDISGDTVNIASRIQALAENGGICVTRQVYDQVQNKLDFPISSLGSRTLKNVSRPQEIFKIVMPWNDSRASPKLDKRRIAILPFSNISPDRNDEYFADGMTEELITAMSKISGLKVIARTSVMSFKNKEKKIDEIANELNAGTILEGSVRKAGDRLRITVQLIDSETSDHIWSESYDREMKDIFAIQGEISKTVADALKVRLLAEDKEKIEKIPTQNMEAYALYLKGMHFDTVEFHTEEGLRNAIKCLERAIELDPSFALAYAGLADAYASLAFAYSKKEEFPKAERAISKAFELDSNMAFAHVAFAGILYFRDGDYLGAERETRKALELDPNVPEGRAYLAYTLIKLGKLDEALAVMEIALEQDPLSELTIQVVVDILRSKKEYARALELLRKVHEFGVDNPWLTYRRGWFYLYNNRFDEALQEFEARAKKREKNTDWPYYPIAVVYAKAGQKEKAKKILEELEKDELVPIWHITPIYAALGEDEQTLNFLEKALERKDAETFGDIQDGYVSPLYDNLRDDPRFVSIMKKAEEMKLQTK